MANIRNAVAWARSELPAIAFDHRIDLETSKIAVIGWSTGGHLAMTTAWTTVEAGMEPATAILNFYGPFDFEAFATASHPDQTGNSSANPPFHEAIRQSLPSKASREWHFEPPFPGNNESNDYPTTPTSTPSTTSTNSAISNYHIPTFIVPVTQSLVFHQAMMDKEVESGFLVVEAAKHIHDVGVAEGSEMWVKGIGTRI
ncbi:hypothetical protein XPA_000564 [Xanthoria parietina]